MSLFKKITILFIISFTLMTIIGLWIDNINSNRIEDLIKDKYTKVANELLVNLDKKKKLKEIEKNYDLTQTEPIDNITILHKETLTFGYILIGKKSFEDEFIIQVQYLDEELTYKTKDEQNITDKTILNTLIFIDISVLVLIFLYILKLLSPLKKITLKMKEFSNGNLQTRINIDSKDEIGILSNSFDSMANNLENLIKTREELLRDIGHELRTPIAKGKFAIEKIENSKDKEVFKKIFKDLEVLTNDLIELEKLNTDNLKLESFSIETLVLNALQKLHIEDESSIKLEIIDNFAIYADLHYLSVAIKNLVDNALKYSTAYPVIIKAQSNTLSIKNKGEKLDKGLTHYLEPFTQMDTKKDGFGLGLSIVNKVLLKHNLKLEYQRESSYNSFKIVF